MLMEEPWDLIIHVGHVVPHEVLGFANHNKNYFIGLAGKEMILRCAHGRGLLRYREQPGHAGHAGAGVLQQGRKRLPRPPARRLRANRHGPKLTGELVHTGLYVGDDLETYLHAARQSREQNITALDKPLDKVVCVMQGDEFYSTWVANKAVYRTRMALADGGELIILAPGLKRFGEQPEVDAIIRKYGYCGTPKVMECYRRDPILQDFAHATAHLIHGSSEGRFTITYAPGHMSKAEIESVNFRYADLGEMLKKYPPDQLKEGFNDLADGERVFFIPTPSAGLWATREKLYGRSSGFDT